MNITLKIAPITDNDQTLRMCRLIMVCTCCKGKRVCRYMRRLQVKEPYWSAQLSNSSLTDQIGFECLSYVIKFRK